MEFTTKVVPGGPSVQETAGSYFLLLDTGDAETVDVTLLRGSTVLERVSGVAKGFKARMPLGQFTRVELRSSEEALVRAVISDGSVDINLADGAVIHIGKDERGETLAKPVFVTGLTLEDTPATDIADTGPVEVTDVADVLLAAEPNRKTFRVMNLGPDDVAIGAPGLTWENRVIVLGPGFGWEERDAGPLAFEAVCDTGCSATVNVQELTL